MSAPPLDLLFAPFAIFDHLLLHFGLQTASINLTDTSIKFHNSYHFLYQIFGTRACSLLSSPSSSHLFILVLCAHAIWVKFFIFHSALFQIFPPKLFHIHHPQQLMQLKHSSAQIILLGRNCGSAWCPSVKYMEISANKCDGIWRKDPKMEALEGKEPKWDEGLRRKEKKVDMLINIYQCIININKQ